MTWNLQKSMYKEVAQTLQEARKHARSIENTTASLCPLTSLDSSERKSLEEAEELAVRASAILTRLYNEIAVKAFGQEVA